MNLVDPELYKFTNVTRFFEEIPSGEEKASFTPDSHQDMPTVFVVDGLPQLPENVPGIRFEMSERSDVDQASRPHPLNQKHQSLPHKNLIVSVDKNHLCDHPLRVLYVTTQGGTSASTLMIHAAENSKLTLIEEHLALVPHTGHIAETYLKLESGARIEHIQIGNGDLNHVSHASSYADLQKDAAYRSFIFHMGGKLNRRNLELRLHESGAHGESFNLYLTNEGEHSDINTVIEHLAPDTTSDQLSKGILDGASRGIFTGKIHIHQHAQRVASSQLNKNMLLSKKAQAHSQPQLEIFADDVKCSHGSTTGQLSDEEIFYFESRGIPHDRAKTLLAYAFGMEVVLKIKNKEACEKVAKLIRTRLSDKFQLGEMK